MRQPLPHIYISCDGKIICTFLGVAYVYFVPETITKRIHIKSMDKEDLLDDNDMRSKSLYAKLKHLFYVGNRTIVEAYQ